MRIRPSIVLLGFVGFTVLAIPALAQSVAPNLAASTQTAQSQSPAAQFVQSMGNQAISVVSDQSLTQDQRRQKYRDILRTSFDMTTIGHFVLGRAYDSATPAQQQKFLQLFEQMVLNIYGDRLNFYSGETFKVDGTRSESARDSVVSSEIDHPDGAPPTKIDWRVRQERTKLAVIDVSIDGVSQSVTQRQEFASIIQHDNGNIDGLINMISQKVQKEQQSTQTEAQ